MKDIDDLFQQAAVAFRGEDYARALELLERIAVTEPSPVIHFNIARCHEELGHQEEAIKMFEEALKGELSEAQAAEAKGRIDALEREVLARREREEEARRAQATPTEDHTTVEVHTLSKLNVGLFVGTSAPGAFSDLTAAPLVGLNLDYALPISLAGFVRPIEVGVGMSFSNPDAQGTGFAESLGPEGENFRWELQERLLMLEVNASWRFMPLTEVWSAYVQTGPRLYVQESVLNASGGAADFGEHRESGAALGFFFSGGVDWALGPGSLYGALELGGSDLSHRITGDTTTGAINVKVGYRLHIDAF